MQENTTLTQPSEQFANELKALHDRIQRMERLLAGADSILSTIRYDAELSYSPANGEDKETHRRACQMIEFLGEELEQWREAERNLDLPSDDVWSLMDKAKNGQLIRYGKYQSEPVA